MIGLNSLRRTFAIILKEFKHVWFDAGFFFLTALSPAVLLTLLTYVFSFNLQRADLALVDHDQSVQSSEYIRALTADGDLTVIETALNYDEVIELLQAARVDAALIIPPGFGQQITAMHEAPVSLIVDGTDPSTASQIINSIEQRTVIYTQSLNTSARVPFEVRWRVWFNPNLESQYAMVPGLMSIVLILPAMAVALGVTREKETGTFETLSTTPIRGAEYLIGKLVVYLVMGLVGTTLALAVAVFWFKVPFNGSLPLYLFLTADFLFAIMAFCLIVAHFVPTQRTATSIILLMLFIPSFFQTGLTFPVDKSSLGSQIYAFSLPGTHYIPISRGVMLKALHLSNLMPEAAALFGLGAFALLISIILFNKKIG